MLIGQLRRTATHKENNMKARISLFAVVGFLVLGPALYAANEHYMCHYVAEHIMELEPQTAAEIATHEPSPRSGQFYYSSEVKTLMGYEAGWRTYLFSATLHTQGSVLFAGASGVISEDTSNLVWDDSTKILTIGGLIAQGRIQGDKGADVASADEITLGGDGNYFDITGTTDINHINKTGWQAGSVVVLQFDGSLDVVHDSGSPAGTEASILLSGAGDFSATADDTLQLVYDGTTFREVSRTVI